MSRPERPMDPERTAPVADATAPKRWKARLGMDIILPGRKIAPEVFSPHVGIASRGVCEPAAPLDRAGQLNAAATGTDGGDQFTRGAVATTWSTVRGRTFALLPPFERSTGPIRASTMLVTPKEKRQLGGDRARRRAHPRDETCLRRPLPPRDVFRRSRSPAI